MCRHDDHAPGLRCQAGSWLLVTVWSASVLAAFCWLLNYKAQPGGQSPAPVRLSLPAMSKADALPRLIMFAHPHCPCSRASLYQLERLMTACRGQMLAQVFFFQSDKAGAAWVQSDIWRRACKIPGVAVNLDRGGKIALSMGAETSGHTLLYSPSGKLVFAGGLTEARGHSGVSRSIVQLRALLRHFARDKAPAPSSNCSLGADKGATTAASYPVFGCPLTTKYAEATRLWQ